MKKATFKAARTWARKLKLTSKVEWNKADKKEWPLNIPKRPESFYTKTEEWTGWDNFLGIKKSVKKVVKKAVKKLVEKVSEKVTKKLIRKVVPKLEAKEEVSNTPSYATAREFNIQNHISTMESYNQLVGYSNLPAKPFEVYKFKGWVSWEVFLGEESKSAEDIINSQRTTQYDYL